ncbi:MAG: LysR family transcriptional regulator [Gammaproteobacteria bacterium]|nr:LysR family transcriptional regulator [Gammaproteobacteria bacterium]
MLKIEEIQAFVYIVEASTITTAAKRLGVAKSAVSRRLSTLEEQLGVELFHRTTRKLVLTESGQGFYSRCLQILTDLKEAEHAVSQAHHELSGQLRVAAPLSFGVMHLGPAILEFQKQHPKLNFDIDFNDRQIDLIQEGFDVGIRIANLKDSSLIARKLAKMSTVVCASPSYIKQHGAPVTPEELVHHPCITYSYLKNPNHWSFINKQGDEKIIKVPRLIQANNGGFLTDAAIAGLGILRQPTFIAYESIANGRLLPVLQDFSIAGVNAYAIYPPTRHLSQRVRCFIDFLVTRFSGVPYWEQCLNHPNDG